MQNKETRFYNIGNLTIEYKGPAFSEMDYLEAFRSKDAMSDLQYNVVLQEQILMPQTDIIHNSTFVKMYEEDGNDCCIHLYEDKKSILAKVLHQASGQFYIEYLSKRANELGTKMIMNLFDLPHQIISFGGVFLHASYIVWKDYAILFTATKQRGKSTQANLWKEHRAATIVNGDRALIRKVDGIWTAFGSPYCGTSKICKNISKPIAAIVILDQSKENHIKEANTLEALVALMSGFTYHTWDKYQTKKVTELAEDMIKTIPFFKLDCQPDVGAVECLEELLCQKRILS